MIHVFSAGYNNNRYEEGGCCIASIVIRCESRLQYSFVRSKTDPNLSWRFPLILWLIHLGLPLEVA